MEQEPLLFRGTVRENLDPSGNFTDASLWDALRSSGLVDRDAMHAASPDSVGSRQLHLVDGSSRAEADGKAVLCDLETELEGYGSNISAGENDKQDRVCLLLIIQFSILNFVSNTSDGCGEG